MKQNLFGVLRSRGVRVVTAATATSLALVSQAHAELPAWATGIVTDASAAVTDTAAAFGPVIAISIVAVVVIRLAKRFSNKI